MAIRGGFQIAEAYVELILDKDRAKRDVRNLPRDMRVDTERSGRDIGDILSRGIRLSIVRHSPLIAAAIAGAMAAGAPVALAGATTLFAGIGAVAAAQSQRVQSAWVGTWDQIKAAAVADAQVLVPTYVNMAARIGQSFEGLRPTIRAAFTESAPQVDILTGSIIRATEAIVGGLARAVERGTPVIRGFGSFIESTGQGIADMFDAMSEHSVAAGSSWQSLGGIVGDLLPLLGELLGQGVEIASVMLPALGGGIHVLLGAVRLLGPLLPPLVTAFAGFRLAQTASGWLKGLAQNLAFASYSAGPLAGTMGKASTAVGALGRAAPVLGAAIGILGAAMEAVDRQAAAWSEALLKGGESARQARDEMQQLAAFVEQNTTGFRGLMNDLTGTGNLYRAMGSSVEEAEQKTRDYLNSLTPLERKQHDMQVAQREVNEAIDRYGVGSTQAISAQERFEAASRDVEAQLAREEAQLHGVTEAMIEMADQAAARASSDIAYRQSVLQTQEAVARLAEVQADAEATANDVSEAQLDIEQSMLRQAEAAKQLAFDALPATMDEQERNAQAARAALKELDALSQTYGGLPPNLEAYRQQLLRTSGQMDTATLDAHALVEGLQAVGQTAEQIPGTKQIKVTAPTAEVVQKLKDLGFTVTDIPGTRDVIVTADTEQAIANVGDIAAALAGVDGTTARPIVQLTDRATGPLDLIISGLNGVDGDTVDIRAVLDSDQFLTDLAGIEAYILGLDTAEAHPSASMDPDNVGTQTDADLADILGLDQAHASPSATMQSDVPQMVADSIARILGLDAMRAMPGAGFAGDDLQAGINGATQNLQSLNNYMAVPTAGLDNGPFTSVFQASIAMANQLAAQRPTPVAGMNSGPFTSVFQAEISMANQLAAQRPTPVAGMNKGGFDNGAGAIVRMIAAINRMAIVLNATAYTGAAENALNWAARSRTSYIYQRVIPAAAAGGQVGDVVRGFAGGGSPHRRPDGRLVGPGGPWDDAIAAVTDTGEPIRVGNREWIVPGVPADRYGERRMRAVVDGTATILTPQDLAANARGMADGGPVAAAVAGTGRDIRIENLNVNVKAWLDPRDKTGMRRFAGDIRQAILDLEREQD